MHPSKETKHISEPARCIVSANTGPGSHVLSQEQCVFALCRSTGESPALRHRRLYEDIQRQRALPEVLIT